MADKNDDQPTNTSGAFSTPRAKRVQSKETPNTVATSSHKIKEETKDSQHSHHHSSAKMLFQEAAGGLCAGVIGTGEYLHNTKAFQCLHVASSFHTQPVVVHSTNLH